MADQPDETRRASDEIARLELELKRLELAEKSHRAETIRKTDELDLALKELDLSESKRRGEAAQVRFDRVTGYARASALIIIPIVVAILGNAAMNVWRTREVSLGYVEIAAGILSQPPSPENENMREWAIETLQRHATVQLSAEAQEELRVSPLPESASQSVEVRSRNPGPVQPVQVTADGGDLVVTVEGEDANDYSFYLEFLQNQIPPNGDFRSAGWNGEQLVISPDQLDNEFGNFVQGSVDIDQAEGMETYTFSVRFTQGTSEPNVLTFSGSFDAVSNPFPWIELELAR